MKYHSQREVIINNEKNSENGPYPKEELLIIQLVDDMNCYDWHVTTHNRTDTQISKQEQIYSWKVKKLSSSNYGLDRNGIYNIITKDKLKKKKHFE